MAFGTFMVLFGLFECLIGILFLVRGAERFVLPLLLVHMIMTTMPLFLIPAATWSGFMVPTLEGQYIIKNIVIIASALCIAAQLSPMKQKQYPMRINKYLALKGYSTRRGADELIEKKKVYINGAPAKLGDKVIETDVVEVKKTNSVKPHVYVAFYKPVGVITHSAQEGEQEIKDIVPIKGVFPLGRLDKDSEGLILLTNDGRITDKLLNPEYDHTKEYVVTTASKLRSNFKEKIEGGLMIEGYKTKPCKVKVIGDNTFSIVLTEGKKHQIRRMVSAMFNEVVHLKRQKIMNIELGHLRPGQHRVLGGEELDTFLKSLGTPAQSEIK